MHETTDVVSPRAARRLVPLVLAVAAAVRFWGLDFGLPNAFCRPDEYHALLIARGFLRGSLHPHFFHWPTLYLYALAALYAGYYFAGRLAGLFGSLPAFLIAMDADASPFLLLGRALTAVLGTATVALAYAVGRRLAGRLVGLLAALFLSLAFLHARDSHFAVTDAPATCLIMAAFLGVVSAHQSERGRDAVLAGLLAGLATATKYTAAPLLACAGVSAVLQAWQARGPAERRASAARLALFAGAFGLGFVAGTPFALFDPRLFVGDVLSEAALVRAGAGIDLGRGWSYHLRVSLRYGLGLPLLGASLAGAVTLAARDWRRAVLLWTFPAVYYTVAGPNPTVFLRYAVPLVPFLCVSAASFVGAVAEWAAAGRGPRSRTLVTALLAFATVLPSATSLVRFDRLLARTDTRLLAARWIAAHVRRGSSLYQTTSGLYGLVQLPRSDYDVWTYNAGLGTFRTREKLTRDLPEWILLQESPLVLYSQVPAAVRELLAGPAYVRVQAFEAMDLAAPGNVYDQQDAFFLPIAGFHGIRRPGPNLYVYRWRDVAVP